MAVALPSSANSGWTSGTSATVAKPSGLAVGDLMIWHLIVNGNNVVTPSGWTAVGLTNAAGSVRATYLYYKFADSGDVAASNFSTSIDTGGTQYFASIVRITGGTNLGSILVLTAGQTITNTATPALTGLTPNSRGDSMLIQFWAGASNVASIATYAIVTSNPSWNEVFDVASGGEASGVAYALRPQTTATGNFSCAGGDASSDWAGWMVSVAPAWTISVGESINMTEAWRNNISILVQEAITLTETVVATVRTVWSTISKNISTWINRNKS